MRTSLAAAAARKEGARWALSEVRLAAQARDRVDAAAALAAKAAAREAWAAAKEARAAARGDEVKQLPPQALWQPPTLQRVPVTQLQPSRPPLF